MPPSLPEHKLPEIFTKSPEKSAKDSNLVLPSSWLLRPRTSKLVGTAFNCEVSNESVSNIKRNITPAEEYLIRSLCPVTLGHLLPCPYGLNEGREDFSDFVASVRMKTDEYLRMRFASKLESNVNSTNVAVQVDPDSIKNDVDYVERKRHKKFPKTKNVMIPPKVNYFNNCLMADSFRQDAEAMALTADSKPKRSSQRLPNDDFECASCYLRCMSSPSSNFREHFRLPSIYQSHIGKLRLEMLKLEEQRIMNHIRKLEYQRLREPVKKWYELKNTKFYGEAKRNNLQIRNEHRLPEIEQKRAHLKSAIIDSYRTSVMPFI